MKYILFTLVIVLSTGCFPEYKSSNKSKEVQRDLEKEKNKIMEELKKKFDVVRSEYIYKPNRRDPFLSVFMKHNDSFKKDTPIDIDPDIRRKSSKTKITDLQRFNIDELKLTAIIYGTSTRRGMIVDPTGKSHLVREGQFVGKNFGKIASIKKDRIIIHEETYTPDKKKIRKNIVISINPIDAE